MKSISLALVAMVVLQGIAMSPTHAQDYPHRPITIVVGYPPGGSADATARAIAGPMGKLLGQTVIVENKAGAAGNIAASYVARANPDGYTLLLGSSSLAINHYLYKDLKYDVLNDFVPIGAVVTLPLLVSASPQLGVADMKSFVKLAKANPGTLAYGTSGIGSLGHLSMETFKHQNGIDVRHIPYRGSAPMLTALMTGEVGITFDAVTSGLPFARSGKIRALAVTGAKRLAVAPEVPTIGEAGFPEASAFGWYGLLAPKSTPPAIVERINSVLQLVLAAPVTKSALQDSGDELAPGTPQQFLQTIKNDLLKYQSQVKVSGATVE